MKPKSILWPAVTLLLFLILIAGFCWSQNQIHTLKEAHHIASYQAESQYQRSFGELSDSLQAMNQQLAQLLVTTSQEHLMLGLSSLWREMHTAVSHLGGLPIAMYELENTDLLLSDMAAYSQYLIRQNVLHQKPLAEQDWNQLEDFYRRSRIVQIELDKLENRILNENLLFTSLSMEDEENAVANAFRSIESQVHAFPELILEEGVRKIEPEVRTIAGPLVSREEAVAAANNFLDTFQIAHSEGQVEFVSENTPIPIYGIRYKNESNNNPLYVEVSQNGGHVLQFYQNRKAGPAAVQTEDAVKKAEDLLQRLHFTDMACIDVIRDEQIADLTFVPKQNGIYIYSDMVKVQMALDDNTILNFDQTSYATRHYERNLPKPAISREQILAGMNPNFQVEDIRLALIPDEYSRNEILTYEVRGLAVEEPFSVFADASTGREIRIVRRFSPEHS